MRRQVTVCYKAIAAFAGAGALAFGVVACGSDETPTDIVLVTHDSFVISDDVKQAFERESGLRLRILQSGDAGELLSKALLTAGNPQGDVLFGVDNNLLSRALDGDLFEPYESPLLEQVDEDYALDPEHRVTPIDHGEVCLNYDKAWFSERAVEPPRSLDDLADPRFENLVVVENPATSTPGLAFLLATVARYGEPGWQDFWRELRENRVLVADGWEEAYNVRFSGAAGKGERPIVVSYASSPPAEVIFATPRPKEAPTAVVEDSCFRQIEFAGVLRGTRNGEGARKLVDFLLATRFQEDVPLSMFVFPVNRSAVLPPAFTKFAVIPENPLELPAADIGANRDRWVKEWTSIVLR
ncbi:MAG: thiamine ABC transporter substrate-binding protein [Actinobacteria bacterium]|nr:thiamine ABC transporter substrate-binding protein [Actinomycetota bacterium]MBA3561334.1 thiamine ABC transporter substrate-binding protein [Actinomycetota bacterium]MBA3566354.1 thiamine ABC transporter substrate-binding protein [Actinomycetota bacterium]MDQ3424907.1 thiamine ABC transporter substrate-binding protein [Actinomycetota bacterium]